ncbi:hypothetical protein [Longibaculum muris]|uniref:hypothetical protein n=1 Tax=Longibaculum muris TaxID=1796628 RepID=UPI003AB5DAB8
MSKYWKNIGNNKYGKSCHALYFTSFGKDESDDAVIAIVAQDNEDTKYYNYTSKEMNVEDDWLFGDNIDDIKDEIEEMLIEHWENEVEYLEDKLKAFKEEE